MTVLVIDVDALTTLGTEMKTVGTEFAGANTNSDNIASAVGHSGLAEAVRHFAHGWDDKRGKMVDAINALGDAATAVADTWRDADQQAADALNGNGGGSGGPNTPQAV